MQLDVSTKPMVAAALKIATEHHKGVARRYTYEPYIEHPIRVAETLLRYGFTGQEVLSAALLHDVMEDPSSDGLVFTADMLRQNRFDTRVVRWVELLTNTEKGTRAERKVKERERIWRAPQSVQAIKLADIMDNVKGISLLDPQFAETYIEEKRLLVNGITYNKFDSIAEMISEAKDIISMEMNALAYSRLLDENEALAKQQSAEQAIRAEEEAIIKILAEEELGVYRNVSLF